jgi:hypothetical protein
LARAHTTRRALHHAITFTINGPSNRLKKSARAGFLDYDDRKGGEIG